MSEYTPISCDQVTIQEINEKLKNEILNMQQLMSQLDLKEMTSRLQKMNTLELYNEMMRSVQQNLVKVVRERCHGDASATSDRIKLANSFADSEIEISDIRHEDRSVGDSECSKESLYLEIKSCCSTVRERDSGVTTSIDYEEVKRLYEELDEENSKLTEELKEVRQEMRKQYEAIENLHQEVGEKDVIVKELKEENRLLGSDLENLRKSFGQLKDKFEDQAFLIENVQQENTELVNTLQIYVKQAGDAQKNIEELLNELRLNKTELDGANFFKSILTRKLSKLNTQVDELKDENQHKTEQIEQLEKRLNNLQTQTELNWNEYFTHTQRKLAAAENLNNKLKQIVLKKNIMINMYKKEIMNEKGTESLMNKIKKGEQKIYSMMKKRIGDDEDFDTVTKDDWNK